MLCGKQISMQMKVPNHALIPFAPVVPPQGCQGHCAPSGWIEMVVKTVRPKLLEIVPTIGHAPRSDFL